VGTGRMVLEQKVSSLSFRRKTETGVSSKLRVDSVAGTSALLKIVQFV